MALPIVLLPGMHGTTDLMADARRRLCECRKVLALDYPMDDPLGYVELARFIGDRLPAGRFVVLGESFSGPLAIDIAVEYAGQVAGIVLVSTFARRPLPKILGLAVPLLDHRWLPHRLIEAMLMGPDATPVLRAELRRILAQLSPQVFRRRALAALEVDKTATLPQIRCPALCIAGRRDRLFSRMRFEELMAGLADAELVEIDAPHMLLETHPEATTAAILKFCSRLV